MTKVSVTTARFTKPFHFSVSYGKRNQVFSMNGRRTDDTAIFHNELFCAGYPNSKMTCLKLWPYPVRWRVQISLFMVNKIFSDLITNFPDKHKEFFIRKTWTNRNREQWTFSVQLGASVCSFCFTRNVTSFSLTISPSAVSNYRNRDNCNPGYS